MSDACTSGTPATAKGRYFANQSGVTQLSLVEHALCPLDPHVSNQPGFVHHASYFFSDKSRNRKKASVRVVCPDGLLASDEFYLWGLLAVTLNQTESGGELFATPHYCLRQLGCIEHATDKGGRNYVVFREAVERLAAVSYQNDCFYDPVRGEHRRVGFGFLSYSLPLDTASSRAWRFAWDPIFFEFCQAVGSALSFDLATYRQLDRASRRLYLLLKKVFWRHDLSPAFDLRHLAVNVLGFSDTLETWKLKQKVVRCVQVLLDAGILRLAPGTARPA
ncbi:MAG: hypothetical protein KY475_06130, partial [Planctomycetes bacterium]|nr:hypothetical protein [Planctomycetota bacterium]